MTIMFTDELKAAFLETVTRFGMSPNSLKSVGYDRLLEWELRTPSKSDLGYANERVKITLDFPATIDADEFRFAVESIEVDFGDSRFVAKIKSKDGSFVVVKSVMDTLDPERAVTGKALFDELYGAAKAAAQ